VALTLSVTDGTTTVTLLSGATPTRNILKYAPKTPASATAANVTESAVLYLTDLSNERDGVVRGLNRLFDQAQRYRETRIGPRVFVQIVPHTGEDTYRSEVYDGRAEWDEDILRPHMLPSSRGEVLITWTRAAWWESPETELALTNGNGTNITNGIAVDNQDTATTGYVKIDAVLGDMPTPARIEYKNTVAATIDDLYIGHHLYEGATSPLISHLWQGEGLTGDAATVTGTGDGNASANNYGAITTATYGSEIRAAAVTITNSDQQQWAGGWFRAFLRLRSLASSGTKARLKIQKSGVTNDYIWQGPLVTLSTTEYLQEVALVQLPPDDMLYSLAHTQLVLALYLVIPSAAQVDLDYIAFMPLRHWRAFDETALGLEQNDVLYDDGIEDRVYVYDSSATAYRGHSYGRGEPIMLYPGKTQQLIFISRRSDSTSRPTDTATVKVFCRHRRSTL
jgi:hypothetical protein